MAKAKTPPQGKPVVIVESPAKAKTINKILGPEYVVKACMGHVRDLPARAFGIDLKNNFEPTYETIRGKGKILMELRRAVKEAPAVYLAPDPDREGEAIAWHLVQALKIPASKIRRVTFNEITRRGVLDAFQHPGEIALDRVWAQQARRLLDRIVGYKLSPLLWRKVGRGLSAGRVQSVAVRLTVEREIEIKAFTKEEYWTITAKLAAAGDQAFTAELARLDGQEAKIPDQAAAGTLVDKCSKQPFTIASITRKEKIEQAPPAFTTSLLQQQSSIRLSYTAAKTMMIAQQLYEGVELGAEGSVGLITYMRTDSFRIAAEALDECRAFIGREHGADYLPEKPNVRASRKGAQEAHEAIRPTSVERTPDKLRSYLTEDQFRLYRMIWRRFVASQMKPAVYALTEAQIAAGRAQFTARGKEMRFAGYTLVAGHKVKKDEQILPPLSEGDRPALRELVPAQHFTEPPPRYTEASLVKALERFGIGRPSTYAPIISTIQDRGYVRVQERQLIPTELGMLVTDKLVKHFKDLMSTGFTARMEKRLDRIEDGKAKWETVLKDFYDAFLGTLESAKLTMESEKGEASPGGELCEKCGKPMLIRWNKYGKFMGCSGFPDCRSIKPILETAPDQFCDVCKAPMVIRSGRRGRFLACSRYPDCKQTRSIQRGGRKYVVPEGYDEKCEKCGCAMRVKSGRRGPFVACSGYPNCRNTRPLPKEWYVKTADKPASPEEAPAAPEDSPSAE